MGDVPRRLEPVTRRALADFRVVVVTGPRQAGKTTLVRRVLGGAGTFERLDRAATLQAALADPDGFAAFGELPRAFDEVQRAGDPLIRAIKTIVDEDPARGQFLLNGSADFLTVPTISESLAGRAAFLELWPFTQGEIHQTPDGFLEAALTDPDRLLEAASPPLGLVDYLDRVCTGGFPEVTAMAPQARQAWLRDYVRTVTQRDIKDLSGARRTRDLPKLLRLLAARTAGELVVEGLHGDAGLGSRHTTEAYLGYLQMTYLVLLLPAWSRNLTSKAARRPKIHITDTGLAAALLGLDPDGLTAPTAPAAGPMLETFVVNEISRQLAASAGGLRLSHCRDHQGHETDLIVERPDGAVVAVEVKATSSPSVSQLRHVGRLRDRLDAVSPGAFRAGILLHTGDQHFKVGDRLHVRPIESLWT